MTNSVWINILICWYLVSSHIFTCIYLWSIFYFTSNFSYPSEFSNIYIFNHQEDDMKKNFSFSSLFVDTCIFYRRQVNNKGIISNAWYLAICHDKLNYNISCTFFEQCSLLYCVYKCDWDISSLNELHNR
jgi:hypothetical protein